MARLLGASMSSSQYQFHIAGVLDQESPSEQRARLVRDLHDGLAQDLWFMNLQVKLLQDALRARRIAQANELVDELRQSLETGYSEVRSLILELQRPPRSTDLSTELSRLSEQLRRRTGVEVDLSVSLSNERSLSPVVAGQLVKIAREAVTNIAKHAEAGRVRLQLSTSAEDIRLVVADDGQGFEPHRRLKGRHLGIRSMQERVASIGGKLLIRSAPGYGTTIYITAPTALEWERSETPKARDRGTAKGKRVQEGISNARAVG
jgi:signal transduction histidine kinase